MLKTANTRPMISRMASACADLDLPYRRIPSVSAIVKESNRLVSAIDDELEQSHTPLAHLGHGRGPIFSHSPGFPLRDPRTLESDQDIPAGEYRLATGEDYGILTGYQRLRTDNSCIDTQDRDAEDNSQTGGDYAWSGFHIV